MIPSMYSGVSGLLTHQQRMNVIGNDIANVNTVGYKQSDVTFKEAYVNTLRTPAPGTPGQQLGLGVQLGNITRDFSGGALMQTGNSTNLGLSGNGFFVVADRNNPAQKYYTRSGDYVMDVDAGNTFLATPDGRRLQGVMTAAIGDPAPDLAGVVTADLEDIVLPPDTTSFNITLDGILYVSVGGGEPEIAGRVALATFDNPNGLQAVGSNAYIETDAAAIRPYANPGEAGVGQMLQGYLENSNVDLAREFTDMIVTQRGFQANSRTISTSDDMLQELLTLKR
jgi:flagellar hook protein FlgE